MAKQSPKTVDEALAMAQRAEQLRVESEELAATVASSLPTLRSASSVSQETFSAFAGVSQPYLSQIENGTRTSSPTVLRVTQSLYNFSRSAAEDLSRARKGSE